MEPHDSTPAAGGDRPATEPDSIARDYLQLALRLEKLLPGLIDVYFGPPDLKAAIDAEAPRPAARLREDASALASLFSTEQMPPDRRSWLQAQLVALEAQALMLAGDPLPYSEYVACILDQPPELIPEAAFESAQDDLARLLPPAEGEETLAARLDAWTACFTIPSDRLPAVADWLLARVRDRADRLLGLPSGERAEVVFFSGRPRRTRNLYRGGCLTWVEIDRERPWNPAGLIQMATRECYPGWHTVHAWRESCLVEDLGRWEAGVTLVPAPETLIGSGLALHGERMAIPDEALPDLLLELFDRAGLAITADGPAAREAALIQARIRRAMASLRAVTANAAYMLHAEGARRDEVAAYLGRYLLIGPDMVERRMESIEDPLRRARVVAGHEGERLLRRWFELGPANEQPGRFSRLLREQLTPGALRADLSTLGFGGGNW